ncbi:alpha/beta hydrolase [Nocardioides fonticola]|uniref:Alpha/beta hydrolase n=1 Tax=Nocardioides fonticola TaxID=450363 RepID=A0ABP7XF53_9ACTN
MNAVPEMRETPGTPGTPEIGSRFSWGEVAINYHDVAGPAAGPSGRPSAGTGEDAVPVLLVHGSGPGVTAWANWRLVIPELAHRRRVIAPDMVGFGYTDAPTVGFDLDRWVGQLLALLDGLGLERVHLIGNSFGGAVSLHLADRHPERVASLVLMGPVGVAFELTDGLDAVWGYEPSVPAMGHLVRDVFVADASAITDDLVELRYRASVRPGVQERFAALFPAPRQRWVDALALPPERLAGIEAPVLVVHGRDDRVIPLTASERLVGLLPDARLVPIADCGHWVQIEQTAAFLEVVGDFLARPVGSSA